jgi:hypothetical protein
MVRSAKIIETTIKKLERLQHESLLANDYAYSRGVNNSKLIVESAYAEILALEKGKNASSRRQSTIL